MPEIKKYKITEPYLDIHCGLGEAPYWEQSRSSLRFVDIVNKKLHFVDLTEGPSSLETRDLEYSIGTTADIEGNDAEFVFGGKLGYGVMNRETGEWRWIKDMWTDEERKEDGGGKLWWEAWVGQTYWVGAINDPAVVQGNVTDEGVLFRLDSDLSLHQVLHNVTIPNGMSWTLDNKTMYFTDSPSGNIMAYPYNPTTGEMSHSQGKVFFTCPYEGGVPDGHCQDEDGYLWIACFGTGKVVRVNAEGEVVAEIECPTRCVICPALVGTELIITSAAEEDPEKYPWSKKYQGAVFRADVGVRGCPLNRFKMSAKA